jgi:peptide/nickel transport system permease protein
MCQKNCTPQRIQQITETLGYDKPVLTQYGLFLKGLVAGRDYPVNDAYRARLEANDPTLVTHCPAPCLGYSNFQTATVGSLLRQAAPVTISLAIVSFIIWIVVGVSLGVFAAIHKGKAIDRITVGATLVLYAMPVYVVGIFLLKFMSIKWKLLPYPSYVNFTDNPFQWFVNLLLPSITLAALFMAAYVRITRAFVLETLSEDYIRTAQAKGVKSRRLLFKHALRAALTPIVSMAGLDLASLFAGAVITETVFSMHGLGGLTVDAAHNSDLPVLIGITLVAGAAYIVANIVVDMLYAVIDPRVRLT